MRYLLGSAVSGGIAVALMWLDQVEMWFIALCFAATSGYCAAYLEDWSIEEVEDDDDET
tara:strand:+ start:333 stop:509 length:177 start_codon:yes stop_codon:yes gene_type:complete